MRLGINLIFLFLLTACGASEGSEAQATATNAPTRTPVPTYTPTPYSPPPAAEQPAAQQPTADALEAATSVEVAPFAETDTLPTGTPAPDAIVALAAAAAAGAPATGDPILTVAEEAVNVRSGPGTDYSLIGLTARTTNYPITGRNEAGDWWQVCCIDGQAGWLFAPLVTVENADAVTIAADFVPLPAASVEIATPVPVVVDGAVPSPTEESPPVAEAGPAIDMGGTAGTFDPNAQYQVVHYRVLGFDDNNGGIFNKGGQQLISLTVLDQNGNPVDGAVVKDAVADKLNVVTGSKGAGKAEIKMDWDPYKLYVASDLSGPVTSQISNQMNNPYPHLPDVIGKLGPLDNEYAVCPTPEVNCTPPFFTIHFSYEITFQRVR